MLMPNRKEAKELSVAEAKKNFILAMNELTFKNIVKDAPIPSIAAACAAGAMLGKGASKIHTAVSLATELFYLCQNFTKSK